MREHIKRHVKTGIAAMCMSFFLGSLTAQAYWQNENAGPGVAVWVEETAQAPGETALPEQNASETGEQAAEQGQSTTDETTQQTEQTETKGTAANQETSQQPDEAEQQNENAEAPADPNLVMSNGRQLDLRKPMIALTYDDGPNAKVGNRLMNVLEAYNGRATFFMVGERVRSFPEEVRRMAANGHEVANHSYSHPYFNKIDAAAMRAQVENTNNVIQEVSGVRPGLMRLPGGNKNSTVLAAVNMPIVLWSIDTRDWQTRNANKTESAILGHVKDGDIVLMHELYTQTADATEAIVPKLAAQGFQFVTVSELAKWKGKTLEPHHVYYEIRYF